MNITDMIIPVARLDGHTRREVVESQRALRAEITRLTDEILDLHCDGAELDRERDAYDERDLEQGFESIAVAINERSALVEVYAYTLVNTLDWLDINAAARPSDDPDFPQGWLGGRS